MSEVKDRVMLTRRFAGMAKGTILERKQVKVKGKRGLGHTAYAPEVMHTYPNGEMFWLSVGFVQGDFHPGYKPKAWTPDLFQPVTD